MVTNIVLSLLEECFPSRNGGLILVRRLDYFLGDRTLQETASVNSIQPRHREKGHVVMRFAAQL